MENKGELLYERKSPRPDRPTTIRLFAKKTPNTYPDYIKAKHRTIIIEITHAQQCPNCKNIFICSNELAYSIADQLAMWKYIFKVIVLPHEKARKLSILKEFIRKLEQIKLNLEKEEH